MTRARLLRLITSVRRGGCLKSRDVDGARRNRRTCRNQALASSRVGEISTKVFFTLTSKGEPLAPRFSVTRALARLHSKQRTKHPLGPSEAHSKELPKAQRLVELPIFVPNYWKSGA